MGGRYSRVSRLVLRPAAAIAMAWAGLAVAQGQRADAATVPDRPQPQWESAVPGADYDESSGILIEDLTPVQVESLTHLARIWGFLKYHHPRIASGEMRWDYELFDVMRKLLPAEDAHARNRIIGEWLRYIGDPAPCDPCARRPDSPQTKPRLRWLGNSALLGDEIAGYLRTVYRNRYSGDAQHYVSMHPDLSMPLFENEAAYSDLDHPDAGYRLLALFRFWNIIEYWFPYRNLTDELWTDVLQDFIPRFARAETPEQYRMQLWAFAAQVGDGHVNILNAMESRPPRGSCRLPIVTRFVEKKPIVVAYTHAQEGPRSGIEIGDVLLSVGGEPVDELVSGWAPYYPASNEPTRYRDIGRFLPRGPCEPVTVSVDRDGGTVAVSAARISESELVDPVRRTHDLPGETFRFLTDDIAYLKLSSIELKDVTGYIERAAGSKGLIVDLRNYPNEFVVFELGQHLVSEPTSFVRFTGGDISNPGTFVWLDLESHDLILTPEAPHYSGKVVVLVDEVTQSQSEYTTMALRAAPNTIVIGSTTAGADGNVTSIALPGGLQTRISGIGVFYPDGTPTQRVGIVPDVFVTPTIGGLRRGVDEALELAMQVISDTH